MRNDYPQRVDTTGQKGSALVMAVFVLVLLTGIGVALLFLSQTELKMGAADTRAKKVFYLAEAAIENGRAIMAGEVELEAFLNNAAGDNGQIDFHPDAVTFSYASDGSVTAISGYGDDVPLVDVTDFGEGRYAAFLTNDAVDGEWSTTDSNRRAIITGIGVGPDGSLEVAQAVIVPIGVVPVAPALVTLLGPDPEYNGGWNPCSAEGGETEPVIGDSRGKEPKNSKPSAKPKDPPIERPGKTYKGTDCADPNLWVPTVGTIGPQETRIAEEGLGHTGEGGVLDVDTPVMDGNGQGQCENCSGKRTLVCHKDATAAEHNKCITTDSWSGHRKHGDYCGPCIDAPCIGLAYNYVSGIYNDYDTFADLTDPTEPTVVTGHGPVDSSSIWRSCSAAAAMMEELRGVADYLCTGDSCSLPATHSSHIAFIDGDLTLDETDSGSGLLAVTGTLYLHGDTAWDGYILLIGEGRYERSVAGSGLINGAIVLGNVAGPDGTYGTMDDCSATAEGFGSATFIEPDGMDGGDTTYCSTSLYDAIPPRVWDVQSFRQR